MTALFKKLFGLERQEITRAVLMFLYAFLLLSAYLILKPVRNSLFLDKFGADQLIYMYMIIAVTATPIASFYGWTAARMSLPRLVGATTLVIILNLAAFWYLIGQQLSWLVYVFYVWVSLFGVFTTSQFWLLANYVFDPREAKRVFPFVAAGAILGGITGSLLTNLFAELVGTENLLWLCMAFLLICFGILLAVWNMRRGDDPEKSKQKKKSRDISGMLPVILHSRHLKLLALMIALTVMVSTFVDFQFNKIVKDFFEDKDRLTAFFGAFFFWLSLISLVLQLLLSSRVLRRFGVGAAILFLPVGLLLGSTAIFLFPVLASAILVKISDGSFRYSINKTGLELLYLPIPTNIKNRVKAFMDVVGDRFARGIGGGLLYIVNDMLHWPVQWISFLSAALIGGWIAVAVMIKREYSRTFRAALEKGTIDAGQLRTRLHDAASMDALTNTFTTGNRRQILFALELTAQATDHRLAEPLAALLVHDNAVIRKTALSQLATVGNESILPQVEPLVTDDDPEVQVEAIRLLCLLSPSDKEVRLRDYLHADDPVLQASACRCTLKYNISDDVRQSMSKEFVEALNSHDDDRGLAARRQLALALQSATPADPLAELFPAFLADDDPVVRRGALLSAASLNRRDFIPVIIDGLAHPKHRGMATDALLAFGPSILGTLRDHMLDSGEPLLARLRLPKIISLMPGDEAAAILSAQLQSKDAMLRHNVIRGLGRLRRSMKELPIDASRIRKLIEGESRSYYAINGLVAAIQQDRYDSKAETLLLQALSDRQKLHLEQAFRLAGLIYPIDDMRTAYNGIVSGTKIVRARAIEFLDTVWDRSEKAHLFPILEENARLDEAGRRLFDLKAASYDEAIRWMLRGDDPWLAACAAFVVSDRRLDGFNLELAPLTESANAPLREASRVAMNVLAAG